VTVGQDVIIAYVDESGDTGNQRARSSATYTLGCVLVNGSNWNGAFNDLIAMHRRIRDRFDVPMRAEIKANFLVRGAGSFKKLQLAPAERHLIYRAHLRQKA
jgi:hypothetical protein